ncbi:MAG TPA: hypothetical protein VFF11_14325 [Candidatus Binatia bacterium]|nr:hypothetical protein [Candidatus Binatia bacterium]
MLTPLRIRKSLAMKRSIIIVLGLVAMAAMISVQSVSATLSWSSPLTLNSPNIVGIAKGTTGSGQGNWTYESAVAQALLDLGANQLNVSETIYFGSSSDDTLLSTSPTDYNGTVIAGTTSSGGAGQQVASGWDYVIAKYDGKNAGYILFYLGGQAADLPQFPNDFWTTKEQYGISGWTAFNVTSSVPEPSTIVAGALLLLPFGVSTVRILRKNRQA